MNEFLICLTGVTVVFAFIWLSIPFKSKWHKPGELLLFLLCCMLLIGIIERMWYVHTHWGQY